MIWVVIIFYLLVWTAGVYLIWKAYRLGIRKDLRHAKKLNGVTYKHPHRFIRKLAIIDLAIGLAVIVFAIAIPLLKIKFQTWGAFVGGFGLIRQGILMGLARKDY
ncbi:MAG: hypothetical protein ACYC0P_06120 [Thiobacillus sp.]